LDKPDAPPKYLHIAARIFQEVSRDPSLAKNYGEVDLQFIQLIKTPELVVALIRSVQEDVNLHLLNVGELFKSVNRTDMNITDEDVLILSENLPLCMGFDLSFCYMLTNLTTTYLSRLGELRILNLEGCLGLTDGVLDIVAEMNYRTIEFISLAGNSNITDNCFTKLAQKCKNLTLLNVSGCPQITHDALVDILKQNRRVSSLMISGTYITDEGLATMANVMSAKNLTCLDLSFCREISDMEILSISEKCTSVSTLNLCGLNRITDNAARAICANFWSLRTLSLEDVFLLDDSAFWFDRVKDGRPIANESMLTSLKSLNLKDCINITDRAIEGLCERCRQIEILNLRGCEKLKDESMVFLTESYGFKVGLCDSLKVLDLSYCSNVSTGSMLDLLAACGCLEELFLEGLIGVNDDFIHQLCISCRTITKLSLQRCQMVTDASLCSIADFLWIEKLDISYCTKITDPAIETISLVCNAIRILNLRRLHKITPECLFGLVRNCRDLQELDIRDCRLIDSVAVENMKKFHPTLMVQFSPAGETG